MDTRNQRVAESSSASSMASGDTLRNDWFIPQLFTSVPALNEAASYLAETTSTSCFSDFSVLGRTKGLDPCVFPTYVAVEHGSDDPDGREMVTFVSGETRGPLVSNDVSSRGSTSSCAESSYAVQDAPSVCDERAGSSAGDSSQNSCALVNSAHTSQSSIRIFQGLIERGRPFVAQQMTLDGCNTHWTCPKQVIKVLQTGLNHELFAECLNVVLNLLWKISSNPEIYALFRKAPFNDIVSPW